jgi:hypothetical protein
MRFSFVYSLSLFEHLSAGSQNHGDKPFRCAGTLVDRKANVSDLRRND